MARVTVEKTFSQADFDAFAELSGDHNPIHVDPAFSARSRFGRTVAHGLLLCTVLRGLVDDLAPGSLIDWQEVMFPAPTFADDPMVFTAEHVDSGSARSSVALKVAREDGTETLTGLASIDVAESPPESPPEIAPEIAPIAGEGVDHQQVGQSAGVARTFTLKDLDRFRELSGSRAALAFVPEPLIGALFSKLLGVDLPGLGTNYLKQATRFVAQAEPDEPLDASVTVTRVRVDKKIVDLSTRCYGRSKRLIADGRALVYVGDVGEFPLGAG